jgi:MerR family copper efflux transcriptional regulator
MKTFTVGQVARRSGVGIETVRFYERQGLLDEPERRESGYRQYGDDDVAVLRFIRRAKRLGFTLKEIKALLALRLNGSATRSDVRAQATAKIADIGAKIRDLQRMREALSVLTAACHGDGQATGCPILEALNNPDDDGASDEAVATPAEE